MSASPPKPSNLTPLVRVVRRSTRDPTRRCPRAPHFSRPRTARSSPFRRSRGEGLETLRGLADVVLDPWIDHTPLRLLDGEKLAPLVAGGEADILIVESDFVNGAGVRPPAASRSGRAAATPTTSTSPPPRRTGSPCSARPGRNADAVAEIAVALLFAVNRGIVAADLTSAQAPTYRDGTIPYQRYRAWQLAGRTAGLVGLGAVGRAVKWRLEGLGMRVIAYDPYTPDATHSLDDLLAESDVVSMHAAGHARDHGPDRRGAVRRP